MWAQCATSRPLCVDGLGRGQTGTGLHPVMRVVCGCCCGVVMCVDLLHRLAGARAGQLDGVGRWSQRLGSSGTQAQHSIADNLVVLVALFGFIAIVTGGLALGRGRPCGCTRNAVVEAQAAGEGVLQLLPFDVPFRLILVR